MDCEHFGQTVDIEKFWNDKLYTKMRCFRYTDKVIVTPEGEKETNLNAGFHRFYLNDKAMSWDDAGFVTRCPAFIAYLRDKKEEK